MLKKDSLHYKLQKTNFQYQNINDKSSVWLVLILVLLKRYSTVEPSPSSKNVLQVFNLSKISKIIRLQLVKDGKWAILSK